MLSSSRPSSLDTTSARSTPSRASAPAIVLEVAPGRTTPMSWRRAPAGFVSGPRKLKIVRTAELACAPARRSASPVVGGREHEAEADLVDAARDRARASRSMRAPSASSTSAEPRQPGRRAVAVLGDRAAGAGGDQRGGRRDVERRAPAAGAGGVEQVVARRTSTRRRERAHRARQPGELVDRLALRAQRDQERRRSAPRSRCRP